MNAKKLNPRPQTYKKELNLLKHVLATATPGDPKSVTEAIENYGNVQLGPTRHWLKIAGDSKTPVLVNSIQSAPPGGSILEIGTYCGFSSIRMAMAMPGVRVDTLEVDPIHVVIARNVIAYAGMSHFITVWTGHSKDLIPRLAGEHGAGHKGLSFSAVFMDQKGSRYNDDVELLEKYNLLEPGAVIIADNVLKPGAPLYLWKVIHGGFYKTQLVTMREFAMPSEDWMSVSVRTKPRGVNDTEPEPPDDLLVLHKECDRMRDKAIGTYTGGRSVTFDEWKAFSIQARDRMAVAGIVATVVSGEHYYEKATKKYVPW